MTTINLRSHTSGNQAVQVLNEVANNATNLPGVAGQATGEQVLDGYLRWTEAAVAALGNVFEADTVSDLIHTQHYWTLRAASRDTVRLLGQVYNELANRRRALTDLAEKLTLELRRWQSYQSILIVPDTNIFLQKDTPFEDIAWQQMAGRMPVVRIVMPIIVVHELDRLKRQGNNTTTQSARRSLRWLLDNMPPSPDDSVLLVSPYPEVRFEFYVHEGPSRSDDADGIIIQMAQRLARLSGMPTKLATYDLAMRIRANTVGVEVEQLIDV